MPLLENLFGRRTDSDAEAAFHRAIVNDPATALSSAAVGDARRAYSQSMGWQIAPHGDGVVLELKRSNLIALRVPFSAWSGRDPNVAAGEVWRGLADHIGRREGGRHDVEAETSVLQAGADVVILFQAPTDPMVVVEVRHFVLDGDTIKRAEFDDPDDVNVVRLPHAGAAERWLCLQRPCEWPAQWNSLLTEDKAATPDESVGEWLDKYFVFDKGAKLTRAEVWTAFLVAHSYVPAQFPENRFGRVCGAHSKQLKTRRDNAHIWWQIKRRNPDVALGKVPYVDAAGLVDAVELQEFLKWRVSMALSPARKAERKLQDQATQARERHERDLKTRYGSQAVVDALGRLEQANGHNESYFQLHARIEMTRAEISLATGRSYKPLDLMQARAEWWTKTGGPSTPHTERYARLVELFGSGK